MNKIYTLLIFALFFGMSSSFAQSTSLRSIEKSATKAMENKDFYSAWQYYKVTTTQKSIKKDSTKLAKQMYKLGESARQFKSYDVAKNAYEMVLASKNRADYPLVEFWLARVFHSQGEYDKAISHYSNFVKEAGQTQKGGTVNSKQEYAAVAESAIQNCSWAKDQREFTGFKMDSLKSVNTIWTEFAPLEHNSSMYYSALEFDKANSCPDPNAEVTRLYTSDYAGAGGMTSPINWAKDEKGTFVAHTAFNTKGDRMYFTLCKRINAAEFECEIHYRDKSKSSGMWGDAVRLPEEVNLTGSTNTQPNIGYDENLGKELLFFVSNRADSLGGANGDMNIYCSIIEPDGRVSVPGKIDVNTEEDDVTPFFNKANKTLYFSSKGYQGFGGYDIYQAEQKGSGFAQPLALEKPINSSYDDYYFSSDDEMETLYFSTNRLGVTYEEEGLETCCDDIYKLEIIRINLEVATFCREIMNPDSLNNCKVSLFEVEETGNERLFEEQIEEAVSSYSFQLGLETDYMIVSTKEGNWIGDTTYISTKGLSESQTLYTKLYNKPESDMIVSTLNTETGDTLTGCTFVFMDAESGETIFTTTQPNEENIFERLSAGKDYKVIATKEEFENSDEFYFNTNDIKCNSIKVPLYLKRGCLKYDEYGLEIYLYFENDLPGRRTLTRAQRRVTETSVYAYDKLYRDYIRQSLIDTFITENVRSVYGYANPQEATQAVESFFRDTVGTEGMDKLELYAQFLNEVCLDEGAVYQIDVMGTTSPRASNSYNLMLSKRRINSVSKYLKNYQYKYTENGVEKVKSLGNVIGKNILLKLDPRGEANSKGTNIPAAYNDPRSIYSLDASKQRRVKLYNFKKISNSIGAVQSKKTDAVSGEE